MIFKKKRKPVRTNKDVSFLIKTILDNIHSPTLAGNNYAVSNATIASDYSGLVDRLFNHLSLPYQIKNIQRITRKTLKILYSSL
ncbi:hypothetical protein BSPWISOXPB_5083 [uncultured Gammaproteobacteria bacterium]|nr:hypothetical protein BSPWISOXPB_5083 [uncultured Gammaproteobacteria bacterium]